LGPFAPVMGLDVGDCIFGDVLGVERWPGPRPAMAGRNIPAPGGYQSPYNRWRPRQGRESAGGCPRSAGTVLRAGKTFPADVSIVGRVVGDERPPTSVLGAVDRCCIVTAPIAARRSRYVGAGLTGSTIVTPSGAYVRSATHSSPV